MLRVFFTQVIFRHVIFIPMIIGEIRRYLRDNNTIRVSRSVRDLAYKALSVRDKLSKILLQEPKIEDIVKEVNKESEETHTSEEVAAALEAIIEPISLYEPVFSDSGSDTVFVMDQISDTNNNDEAWLEDIALKEAIHSLNERERKIINMRFYRGKTQMEIAAEIGISQAQVSRLEKSALDRIKKQI